MSTKIFPNGNYNVLIFIKTKIVADSEENPIKISEFPLENETKLRQSSEGYEYRLDGGEWSNGLSLVCDLPWSSSEQASLTLNGDLLCNINSPGLVYVTITDSAEFDGELVKAPTDQAFICIYVIPTGKKALSKNLKLYRRPIAKTSA